jgi:ketosteroid isomerase-like protein
MSNADIARSYLNAFATGDPADVAGHVTDDFENIQVGLLGTGCSGADTYRERLAGFLGAFTNLRYDVEELIVDGDKVAAAYKMTFTDDGRPMEIEGVMIMTIKDGKIAVRKDYWDGLSHLKQTGLL